MAQLSTIISSILRDMVLAQHEANMYAVSLEEVYKKNGRLERFPLPAIAMGEVELNLRYGVTGDSVQTEQYEINYPELRKVSQALGLQLARTAVGSALPVIQTAFPDNDTGEEKSLVAKLAQTPDLQRDFCAFLGRKILKSMQQSGTSLLNADGTVNDKVLLNCALTAGEENLLYHKELLGLFSRTGGDIVRERAKEAMQSAIEDLLPKLLKDVNLKRKRIMPSVDVTVNSEELSRLPDECIHTLRFHVSPRNIRLYLDEE